MTRCHFCQEERTDLHQSPTDPTMQWCPPGDVECNFRARRRLGIPIIVALEAKARELEGLAGRTRYRIGKILAGDLPTHSAAYRAHLGSTQWTDFAAEQKLLARHRCEDCGHTASDLDTHHLSYERFGHELPNDVVVVCRTCHGRWDQARKAFYREHEYAARIATNDVYGHLLTPKVRDRINERLERAAALTA